MARNNGGNVYLGAQEARALVGRYRESVGRSAFSPLMGAWGQPQRGFAGSGNEQFRRGGEAGWQGGGGMQGAIRREEREQGELPWQQREREGFGGFERGRGREERHEHHELRREEWEAQHPGEHWEERERRRLEWEQNHPGVAFVGADAIIGALASSGIAPRAFLRALPPPTMANRQVLPMNTGSTPVPAATTAQITSRPQRVAFRPERIFVSAGGTAGGAADWIINDVTIGNRSQFAQSGALPGDMFSSVAIDSFVTFETAQTAMDVVMLVTYQGSTEGGVPFFGSIIGTAAV